MQNIQDKEFDQLFKSRFEDAEITPSADLWAGIEAELVTTTNKKSLPVYWMAAAVVLVTLTVGLLVFNKEEKIQLQGPLAITAPAAAERGSAAIVESDRSAPEGTVATATDQRSAVGGSVITRSVIAVNKEQGQVETVVAASNENNLVSMQPIAPVAHLTIKDATVTRSASIEKTAALQSSEETVIASIADHDLIKGEVINENDEATDKKGIRNVGDLINYVVDKVDKREEKFIKFKTDDDDNSSLIGLNIGMIKFNQRKHK